MKHLKTFENSTHTLDINGEKIEIGDDVIIPDPNDGDDWWYGDFSARVDNIRLTTIGVIDADDDYFEIEANRVELEDYDYDEWLINNRDIIKDLDNPKEYYKSTKKYNL